MFVSFDEAFKKSENSKTIPSVILDYLNEGLNASNLKYISDANGRCSLISETGEYKFSDIYFDLTAKMKEILGEKPSINDILSYSYNSQKPIPIKTGEEGYITINGNKIGINRINFDPYKEVKYVGGALYAIPQLMDETISIKLSGDEEEMIVDFHRVPDDSLDWYVYKSDKDKAMSFLFRFNLRQKKMVFNISYELKKAESIGEALKIADIYNAFFYGTGKMNDMEIPFEGERKEESPFRPEKIVYWEKMHKIENRLNICLNPSEEINISNLYIGEILYRTLICNDPVRVQENIATVSFGKNVEEIQKAYDINKPMTFYFEDYSEIELLGIKIGLRGIKAIYNCVISEIAEKDGKVKLTLGNESDDKKKYTVAMYFISEEELEEFRKTHNVIEEFEKSRTVDEYLDEMNK